MKAIQLNNFPTSWNTIPQQQLLKIAPLFSSDLKGKQFDLQLLLLLLNVKWWQFRKHRKVNALLSNRVLADIKQHYEFMYTSCSLTTFIGPLKINRKLWYPCDDRFSNLSIGEFSVTEDLFLQWHNTNNIEYLRYLAAVIYQPVDALNRAVFEKKYLESNYKRLAKLNTNQLLAIGLSYRGCKSQLAKKYKKVFPAPKKSTETPTVKIKQNTTGLSKVTLQMAGGKFGAYNETNNTNVYVFLDEFTEQLIQQEDAKRQS